MKDLAALIDCGISERSNEGVAERPESDPQSDVPLEGLKNPSSMINACSNARSAALWSRGSDKKLKSGARESSEQALPRGRGGERKHTPIDVMYSLVVNS